MPGAVGGPPVEELVNAILGTLRSIVGEPLRADRRGRRPTADGAYRKLRLGATTVQLYTGLVYHGPGLVKEILAGLAALLERDGYAACERPLKFHGAGSMIEVNAAPPRARLRLPRSGRRDRRHRPPAG